MIASLWVTKLEGFVTDILKLETMVENCSGFVFQLPKLKLLTDTVYFYILFMSRLVTVSEDFWNIQESLLWISKDNFRLWHRSRVMCPMLSDLTLPYLTYFQVIHLCRDSLGVKRPPWTSWILLGPLAGCTSQPQPGHEQCPWGTEKRR